MASDSKLAPLAPGDRPEWVFGYGSLMWRPGFPFKEQRTATLQGFHRSFCIRSNRYRGTPDRPGLVLGLDQGGSCTGTAFRIADDEWDNVVDYLNERELVGYAYTPRVLPLTIDDWNVAAYTFVADSDHRHYAGNLGLEKSAEIIVEASGIMGLNRDYLINTVRELEAHGFHDNENHELLTRVEYLTDLNDQRRRI